MDGLPEDILGEIFGHFDSLYDAARFSGTCRLFNKIGAKNWHKLYNHFQYHKMKHMYKVCFGKFYFTFLTTLHTTENVEWLLESTIKGTLSINVFNSEQVNMLCFGYHCYDNTDDDDPTLSLKIEDKFVFISDSSFVNSMITKIAKTLPKFVYYYNIIHEAKIPSIYKSIFYKFCLRIIEIHKYSNIPCEVRFSPEIKKELAQQL